MRMLKAEWERYFLAWVISQAIMIQGERAEQGEPCLPQAMRPLRFPGGAR